MVVVVIVMVVIVVTVLFSTYYHLLNLNYWQRINTAVVCLPMSAQTFTSAGNEGVIYSLSWSPADLHCIVASSSKNGAFILDVEKGKVVRRLTEVKNLLATIVAVVFIRTFWQMSYQKCSVIIANKCVWELRILAVCKICLENVFEIIVCAFSL